MIASKFKGLTAQELSLIIDLACRMAPLTIMKQATKLKDVGKDPCLVLAEHMILAVHHGEEVVP